MAHRQRHNERVSDRKRPRATPPVSRRSHPVVRGVKLTLATLLILVLGGLCGLAGLIYFTSRDLQEDSETLESKLLVTEAVPSVIVSADGVELFRMIDEYRKPFTFDQVPKHVREAFIAAEDRRFYEHQGVDPIGLFRAVFSAARDRRVSQGGSTITMQLAKQLVNGSDRSFDRKIRDIALAFQLEKLKTKDQLFELYLKTVYFGESAYGLASAAEVYFGKEIKDLSLSEAAMLARCVRRPSDQNPVSNYRRALANRNVVLDVMHDEGMINDVEWRRAKADRPVIKNDVVLVSRTKSRAPYFVDEVLRTIREKSPDINLTKGGYRVETTIRMDVQRFAEESVRKWVQFHRRDRVREGAFILTNMNGEVVAMVGGIDYDKNQFNVTTQSRRPPGSSFKPIVYAAALQTGKITPTSVLSNRPYRTIRGRPWPKNSGRWEGDAYPLSTSIAYSINRPAVWAYVNTGKETVVEYARNRFGIESKLDPVDSLALGPIGVRPIEMATVYSVFAHKGDRVRPTAIRRIVRTDGGVAYVGTAQRSPGVIEPWVAEQMDGFLRQVVTGGTATAAQVVPNARGKTGTTNENHDAWFCGYTDEFIGIAWVGTRANESMSSSVFGGTVAVKFWNEIMNFASAAYRGKAPRDKVRDDDGDSGYLQVKRTRKVDLAEVESPNAAPATVPDVQPNEPAQDAPRADRPLRVDESEPTPTPVPEVPKASPDPARTPRRDPASTVDPAPPPRRDIAPAPAPKEDLRATESAEICVDTGQRARPFCPETITRSFRKGAVPRRSCPVHRN